jgi:hypothetical protein
MTGNGDKPKRRRAAKPRRAPLLMLGSDGEVYTCCQVKGLPPGVLENPATVIAVRLSPRERDVALDALQPGIATVARTLQGVLDPHS